MHYTPFMRALNIITVYLSLTQEIQQLYSDTLPRLRKELILKLTRDRELNEQEYVRQEEYRKDSIYSIGFSLKHYKNYCQIQPDTKI